MKLRNVIKFVILSTVLSDTCLFATRICRIEVGFCNYQTSPFQSSVSGSYNNHDGVLYFDIDCDDDGLKDEWLQHAHYECFVKPVDKNGKEVDWKDFSEKFPSASEREGAEDVPGDKVTWGKEKKYYKVYNVSIVNNDWVDASLGIDNDTDGFSFRCGRFFMRLDKAGVLYLSGGEKGDSLLLKWKNQTKCEGLPDIPVVFDNEKALEREHNKNLLADVDKRKNMSEEIFRCENKKIFEGSTLLIENLTTAFTNKGSIGFDNIILRNATVKNERLISVRNLILENESVLENEGEIRWSDIFDCHSDSKVVSDKSRIVQGKNTEKSYKIEPIVDGKLGNGFGYWLRWDSLPDCKGIEFLPGTRGVTLYLTGQYIGNRRFSYMDFVNKKTELNQKIEEAYQDKGNKVYQISSYRHWNPPMEEQVYDVGLFDPYGSSPTEEQVYAVGLFDPYGRLCPVCFKQGEANNLKQGEVNNLKQGEANNLKQGETNNLYVIWDCKWDDGLDETRNRSREECSFPTNDSNLDETKENSSLGQGNKTGDKKRKKREPHH